MKLDHIVVMVEVLSKGIEQDTMKRMSEILEEEGSIGPRRIAVLSGPTWPRRW